MADAKTAKINRLNRIAGQVRGLAQMIEDDRYCMDILHQLQAVKSALAKVETQILKDHAACCVAEAIASGVDRHAASRVGADESADGGHLATEFGAPVASARDGRPGRCRALKPFPTAKS